MQSVPNGRTDAETQTNMPPQLRRSWGHKNQKLTKDNDQELIQSK